MEEILVPKTRKKREPKIKPIDFTYDLTNLSQEGKDHIFIMEYILHVLKMNKIDEIWISKSNTGSRDYYLSKVLNKINLDKIDNCIDLLNYEHDRLRPLNKYKLHLSDFYVNGQKFSILEKHTLLNTRLLTPERLEEYDIDNTNIMPTDFNYKWNGQSNDDYDNIARHGNFLYLDEIKRQVLRINNIDKVDSFTIIIFKMTSYTNNKTTLFMTARLQLLYGTDYLSKYNYVIDPMSDHCIYLWKKEIKVNIDKLFLLFSAFAESPRLGTLFYNELIEQQQNE